MRTLISTLILVVIIAAVVITVNNDPGAVTITVADKTIHTSLAFLLFVFLLAFIALTLLMKLAFYIYHSPEKFSAYRQHKKANHARNDLTQGLIDLAEGKWLNAERKLARLADYSDAQLINYLCAARAAQHLNADNRRDDYLKKAIEKNPEAKIAVGITQAELQLSHNQTEQALATLNWLQELAPKHLYVKKLLAKIYQKIKDWDKLIALLPELKKHQLFDSPRIEALEKQAYLERIATTKDDKEKLETMWQSVPKTLKTDTDLLYQYFQNLLNLNDSANLESSIRSQIEKQWDEKTIRLYGLIEHDDSSSMLNFAEKLLTKHDKSPMLFLTLGRLCIKRELWGKAKTYFQQSLQFKANIEAYQALAQLHTQLGEHDEANKMYKEGLKFVSDKTNTVTP